MTSTLGRSTRHAPSEDDHLDPERFRILVGTAARLPAVTVAVVATVMVTTLVVANSDLTGVYAAVAGAWLALHQVTLTIDGTSLGVLPLLPTGLLVWLSARGAGSAADAVVAYTGYRLEGRDIARITAATLAGPLIVTVIALVVMQDASAVLPVASPNPAAALAWVTGLYLLAALLGIGSRTWRPAVSRYGVPEWLVLSVRPAARAVLGMFAVGGVLVVAGLVWSWTTVGDLLARGESWTGVLGLTVLSILYLPNLVIGASALLAGSTVQFGQVRLSLFEASGGDLPALPILAAIPAGPAHALWPVLLAVPATVGALLGRFAAQRTLQAQADGAPVGSLDAARTVLAAAAAAGLVTAAITWAAGGPLGIFGVVGANWWLAGVLVFAWAGLLGLIVAQLLMWREGRLAAASLDIGHETMDYEDDEDWDADTDPDLDTDGQEDVDAELDPLEDDRQEDEEEPDSAHEVEAADGAGAEAADDAVPTKGTEAESEKGSAAEPEKGTAAEPEKGTAAKPEVEGKRGKTAD
ncbi:DUF6350 family protein [Rhodococcus coprophilus]|uniref:cell division protein PerM n=1 Tax=Rhodococcus coprophilus TaxID=38310 RepID=UPI00341C537D